MKLASYKDGSRDGQLVVVSRDLSQAHYASHVANRLQQVLDDWNYFAPQLQDVADALNAGRARHAFAFDPAQCLAPLPRAYQCVQAAAWPGHAELLDRAAARLEQPQRVADPALQQRSGDALLGAREPVGCSAEAQGLDFAAGLALISGDIPQGCTPERALDGVRLLMLCNAFSLRALVGPDGHPTLQSCCATAFGPVAITPDELGPSWRRGRVHLAVQCSWNGRMVGQADAGEGMGQHFGQLLGSLAQTRAVRAGSIVAAAPLGHAGAQQQGQWGWPQGYHSIAQKRAMEVLQGGQAVTDYLRVGDTVRIDLQDASGRSPLGWLEQEVVAAAVQA